MLPITYLFVPGDRPERFDKAFASAADAIIIDLEDAVAADRKRAARDAVASWRQGAKPGDRLALRVNDATTPWFGDDLRLAHDIGVRCVVLPKAEAIEQIAAVRAAVPGADVVALIESARGVQNVDAIAAAGVQRLGFGTIDYAVDLELSGDERGLLYPASRIAIASRVSGIGAPVAGVTTVLDDGPQMQADLAFARAFGFGAKLCIHPRQVDPVKRAFLPNATEIDWARRVIEACKGGTAVQVDGRMVDKPVMLLAETILARASLLTTESQRS
jgi:citrate lyase subunit beta/citryl-CoA lyase